MDNNIERWYSMKEIMEHLGVSRDTVLDWIERRNMPAAKIGRQNSEATHNIAPSMAESIAKISIVFLLLSDDFNISFTFLLIE